MALHLLLLMGAYALLCPFFWLWLGRSPRGPWRQKWALRIAPILALIGTFLIGAECGMRLQEGSWKGLIAIPLVPAMALFTALLIPTNNDSMDYPQ